MPENTMVMLPAFDAGKLLAAVDTNGMVSVDTDTHNAFFSGAEMLRSEATAYNQVGFYVRLTGVLATLYSMDGATPESDSDWKEACKPHGVKDQKARDFRQYARKFHACNASERADVLASDKGAPPSRNTLRERLEMPESDKLADALVRAYSLHTGVKAGQRSESQKAAVTEIRNNATGFGALLAEAAEYPEVLYVGLTPDEERLLDAARLARSTGLSIDDCTDALTASVAGESKENGGRKSADNAPTPAAA